MFEGPMLIVIIICSIIVYFVIGFTFKNYKQQIKMRYLSEDEQAGYVVFWPIIVLYKILNKVLSSFWSWLEK